MSRKSYPPAVYLDLSSKVGEARVFTIDDVLAENAKLKEALRGCVEISKLCMCSTCTMESPVCNDGPCVIVKAFIKAREVLREGGAGAC